MKKAKTILPEDLSAELLLDIARRHGATSVSVFGSTSHGTATATSNLDLLVELEAGRDLFDLADLKREIEEKTGRRVDVVTRNSLSPYISEIVLREAVPCKTR